MRFFQYFPVFLFFLRDSLLRFRKKFVFFAVSGLIGTFFQITAVAQILYFSKKLDSGEGVVFLSYTFDPRSEVFFFSFITLLLFFLILSSVLLYVSNSQIIKLAVEYEAFCSKRVSRMVAFASGGIVPGWMSAYDQKGLAKLVASDSRYCGRILRLLYKLFQPTVTFSVALLSLFYIDIVLTISVFFLVMLTLAFHYKNNLSGAALSRNMELSAPLAVRIKRSILKVASRQENISSDFFEWVSACYASGDIQKNLVGFRGRFQTLENARFINDITMALVLSGVAFFLGVRAFSDNSVWGELIVYLVALRYCLNHLKTTLVTFTSINRFYPQFSRYMNFIRSHGGGLRGERPKVPFSVQAIDRSCSSEEIKFRIKAGDKLSLLTTDDIDIVLIGLYLKSLLGYSDSRIENLLKFVCHVKKDNTYLPGLSFREMTGIPFNYSLKDIQIDLQYHGFTKTQIACLPNDLDNSVSREQWNSISDQIRYSLPLLSALSSENILLFLDRETLSCLPCDFVEKFFLSANGKIIFICISDDFELLGKHQESYMSIFNRDEVVLFLHRERFLFLKDKYRHMYDSTQKKASNNKLSDDIYEDEDDDMD